jgi:hypothetical protein
MVLYCNGFYSRVRDILDDIIFPFVRNTNQNVYDRTGMVLRTK